MRADRLVAILLLLQSRQQVTAAEVAVELEISERTARRDLDALGMAGLPVYSQQGRGGGWRLAGGGRTDLSGLSAPEARALFLVAGPSAGAKPEVKAALRKLVRALPEPMRGPAEAASTKVVIDSGGWGQRPEARPDPPLLDAVQRAVIDGVQADLGYLARNHKPTTRLIQPLGLAAKGSVWYLVAGTDAGLRTFRVDRMRSFEATDTPVVVPDGFDLAEAWRLISDEVEQRRAPVRAAAVATPEVVGWCRAMLGNRVRIGPGAPDGRVEVELRGHSVRSLVAEIAGFGAHLEIIGPPEVRHTLLAVAAELVDLYRPSNQPPHVSGQPSARLVVGEEPAEVLAEVDIDGVAAQSAFAGNADATRNPT